MSEHEQAQMSEAQPCHATTTLGHELRTPLNHIIGYTILLEEAKDGQLEPFSADLQKIHTAGKKLLTLVNLRRRRETGRQRSITGPAHGGPFIPFAR